MTSRSDQSNGEVLAAIFAGNMTDRIDKLESLWQDQLPVLGSMETMIKTMSENLLEVKGDIKGVKEDVGELNLCMNKFNSRVQSLEIIEEKRKQKIASIIKTAVGIAVSVITAFFIYELKLK